MTKAKALMVLDAAVATCDAAGEFGQIRGVPPQRDPVHESLQLSVDRKSAGQTGKILLAGLPQEKHRYTQESIVQKIIGNNPHEPIVLNSVMT